MPETPEEEEKSLEDVHIRTPIKCGQCGKEMFGTVTMTLRVPVGWEYLTKKSLLSDLVTVEGFDHDSVYWTCGCDDTLPAPPRAATPRGSYRCKPIVRDRPS